ncbi:MAG TPA: LPXTG cell wall anchor domain-containing protein [Pyrinomonadaceae bacterium]|nr:LPXTG cell wall anchor domain-containing protein [Pyrinomonadaceae bacterium]
MLTATVVFFIAIFAGIAFLALMMWMYLKRKKK